MGNSRRALYSAHQIFLKKRIKLKDFTYVQNIFNLFAAEILIFNISAGHPTSGGLLFVRDTMSETHQELQSEIAELIVQVLNLDVEPAEIKGDMRLYGEGLGLDSIDILEVALTASKRYGFQLRSDSEDNVRIFSSLISLTQHIAEHRTK